MKRADENDSAGAAEDPVESSDTSTDQEPAPPPEPVVRSKGFKGKGDSLNSMAERDRARHDPAKGSLASRIANLRKS